MNFNAQNVVFEQIVKLEKSDTSAIIEQCVGDARSRRAAKSTQQNRVCDGMFERFTKQRWIEVTIDDPFLFKS